MILLLLFVSFATAQTSNTNCIPTSNLWYDVCDYTKKQCIISNAICPPYGSLRLMVQGAARIQTSEDEAWTFKVDPINRTASLSTLSGCNTNDAKECINAIEQASTTTGNPISTNELIYWSPINTIVKHSFFTIKSLYLEQQVQVRLKKKTWKRHFLFQSVVSLKSWGSRYTLSGLFLISTTV